MLFSFPPSLSYYLPFLPFLTLPTFLFPSSSCYHSFLSSHLFFLPSNLFPPASLPPSVPPCHPSHLSFTPSLRLLFLNAFYSLRFLLPFTLLSPQIVPLSISFTPLICPFLPLTILSSCSYLFTILLPFIPSLSLFGSLPCYSASPSLPPSLPACLQ